MNKILFESDVIIKNLIWKIYL